MFDYGCLVVSEVWSVGRRLRRDSWYHLCSALQLIIVPPSLPRRKSFVDKLFRRILPVALWVILRPSP